MIVVVILGILAAVIIPNVTSFVKKGQLAAANEELAEVGVAGQAAASAGTGGVLATAGLTNNATVLAEIAPYIQGTLKGVYNLLADGSIDKITTIPTWTAGSGIAFDKPSAQFK